LRTVICQKPGTLDSHSSFSLKRHTTSSSCGTELCEFPANRSQTSDFSLVAASQPSSRLSGHFPPDRWQHHRPIILPTISNEVLAEPVYRGGARGKANSGPCTIRRQKPFTSIQPREILRAALRPEVALSFELSPSAGYLQHLISHKWSRGKLPGAKKSPEAEKVLGKHESIDGGCRIPSRNVAQQNLIAT
jgi:hypothetical protein